MLVRDSYTIIQHPVGGEPANLSAFEVFYDSPVGETILDRADTGWKDTVRINPNEMATIAMPFKDYADHETTADLGKPIRMTGRYMYHCHILEHEDHEMMRPFVVMPPAVVEHMHHAEMHMIQGIGTPVAARSPGWYMEPKLCCCQENNAYDLNRSLLFIKHLQACGLELHEFRMNINWLKFNCFIQKF